MNLDQALQALHAQHGLAGDAPAEDGRHYYRFGDVILGLAQAHPAGFVCTRSWVGTVETDDLSVVERLARAALGFRFAPDAALGMDAAGQVFLDLRLGGQAMTHEQLLEGLDRLIAEARHWKAELSRAGGKTGADTETT